MSDFTDADDLSRRLTECPQEFYESGAWYALLQEYFDGYPVKTLQSLLRSEDCYVTKSALCIASELGEKACTVASDVLRFFDSGDPELIYYALDVAVVCSQPKPQMLVPILLTMASPDEFLRRRAMVLLARKRPTNIVQALGRLREMRSGNAHVDDVRRLVNAERVPNEEVLSMITAKAPLTRRYGALIAWHKRNAAPELFETLADSDDPDLRCFFSRGS